MFQGQFCLAFLHSFQLLFHDCGYPRWSLFFTLPNAIFFYYLFSDFYYKAYNTNKKKEVKQSWSGVFCLGFDSIILSFTLNLNESLFFVRYCQAQIHFWRDACHIINLNNVAKCFPVFIHAHTEIWNEEHSGCIISRCSRIATVCHCLDQSGARLSGRTKSLFGMHYTQSVLLACFVHTLVPPPPPHSLTVTSLLESVACFTVISTFTHLDATVRFRWVQILQSLTAAPALVIITIRNSRLRSCELVKNWQSLFSLAAAAADLPLLWCTVNSACQWTLPVGPFL